MKIGALLLAVALVASPASAFFGRAHHRLFGGGHHGHSINAWMGSHRPKLR